VQVALPDEVIVTAPHERGEPLSLKRTVPVGFGVPVRVAVSVALDPTVSGPLVVVSVNPVGTAVPSSVWVSVELWGAYVGSPE
jgi:hypothetical protein